MPVEQSLCGRILTTFRIVYVLYSGIDFNLAGTPFVVVWICIETGSFLPLNRVVICCIYHFHTKQKHVIDLGIYRYRYMYV